MFAIVFFLNVVLIFKLNLATFLSVLTVRCSKLVWTWHWRTVVDLYTIPFGCRTTHRLIGVDQRAPADKIIFIVECCHCHWHCHAFIIVVVVIKILAMLSNMLLLLLLFSVVLILVDTQLMAIYICFCCCCRKRVYIRLYFVI